MGIFDKAKQRIGGALKPETTETEADTTDAPGRAQGERRLSKREFNTITKDVQKILRNNPDITDEELRDALGLDTTSGVESALAFGRRASDKEKLLKPRKKAKGSPKSDPAGEQTHQAQPSSGVRQEQHGSLSLVTFSTEELLQQVEERRSRVSFDLTGTAKFMDNFNQVWSWFGPILFALGTIGEIFLVLWGRQIDQSWFTAGTIVAVSMIAEGTLLAISFASKRLRNRAEKRSTGWTDKEKHKLELLKKFWVLLAIGVAATQIAFVVAQTNANGIGEGGVWAIAIVRSLSALVADAYTAFVSEEKPTTGDLAIEQQDKETQFTKKLLEQKVTEVDTLNAGSIKVQEVGIKAEMDQDRMNTQKEIAKMQNAAQIESMKTEQEQRVMIDRMRNSAMRAVFDPDMDPAARTQILTMLTALASATNPQLGPGRTISSEDL